MKKRLGALVLVLVALACVASYKVASLPLDGSQTMTGSLTMGGNDITGVAAVTATGEIHGKLPVTLDTSDATITLSAAMCKGTLRLNADDDVIDYDLPTAEAGLVVSFGNYLYAQVITVDSASGDIIILADGTALTAADSMDSDGSIDDRGTLVAVDDEYWVLFSEKNEWVDGGP